MEVVRTACRQVADRARHVHIEAGQIPLYATSLPAADGSLSEPMTTDPATAERRAAYWLTLDAINFGSGWFPTLRKASGRSGYFTIADGLRRRFEDHGPWRAAELTELTAAEIASVLGQDPRHELMDLFACSLRDLGHHLDREFDGAFLGPVQASSGSAVRLAEVLARWASFDDTSLYAGLEVPFLKRAQIAAADVHRAGVAAFADLGRLTMFADNLVPHVLRVDGILRYEPELLARIDREELIEHGSPEEVEIRACALHAVELIVAASPDPVQAATLDQLLWQRGQDARYKSQPRHRSRTTAY